MPELVVVDPPLEKNSKGESSPHLYAGDLLCVYHPLRNEWDSSKIIADTIISWISLWLYYYEVWLATGDWKGEGDHPTKKEIKKGGNMPNGNNHNTAGAILGSLVYLMV